jgi:MYXO-CTERM domain-containing protein
MDCWRASALAASLLIASVSPTLANLVTDPGFESCTMLEQSPPPGWSVTSANISCGAPAHSGSFAAEFGGASSTLSQSIPTASGDTYDFSFWLRNGTETPNSFTASFGADQVLNLVNSAMFLSYTFEDFTVTATSASTTIAFTGSANGGAWQLDDVSVTAITPAVPEPPSLGLFAVAALGLAAVYRRRHARPEA